MTAPDSPVPGRIAAVDALRGLVVLMLVPDLSGGFSFHRMAELHPDSALWVNLGLLFTHAPWEGARIWDFVMPVFALMVGVSIPLSWAARSARGDSHRRLLGHAVVRAMALVVLGFLVTISIHSLADDLMPYVVIFGLGLPVAAWLADAAGIRRAGARAAVEGGWALAVLGLAWAWVVTRVDQLGAYNLAHIFILLGLAYLPAFLMVRWSTARQVAAALLILLGYGLAFQLYPAPADALTDGSLRAAVAAHWQNGTNVAAAVDRWLLARLPHVVPYRDDPHGYTTLQFVPLVVTLIAGMMAGRWMLEARGDARGARRIAVLAVAMIGAGGLLAFTLVPLIKSLWTPSWALYSTGVALTPLAVLYLACDVRGHRGWVAPLAVLGSNAVLLYTLAAHDRWRIVGLWQRLLGERLAQLSWQPLAEALLVLVTLWALAALLYRWRVFLRL